jgi:type II secretory pathway component HofQ
MNCHVSLLLTMAVATCRAAAPPPTPSPTPVPYRYVQFQKTAGVTLVTLNVKGADLRGVIEELCRFQELNVVFDPEVNGTVTARLEDVPWTEALTAILRSNGLAVQWIGNVPLIAPPAKMRPAPAPPGS